MERTDYISSRMSYRFLSAAITATVCAQAPSFLYPILAGNFLSKSSIASISLASPIIEACFSLLFLFSVGASYLVAQALSVNQKAAANKHFTMAILSMTAFSCLLAILVYSFQQPLAAFLSNRNMEICAPLQEYLSVAAWSFPLLGIYFTLEYHVSAAGFSEKIIDSSLLLLISNIGLSLLFLMVFGMGIKSFALATVCSYIIGITQLSLRYFIKKGAIGFVGFGGQFKKYLILNTRKGSPLMADDVLYLVVVFLCNLIIIKKAGVSGVVIWSIACTFLTIASLVFSSLTKSSMSLGEALLGTKDYSGFVTMVGKHRKVAIGMTLTILVLVECFTPTIYSLFGFKENIDPQALMALRLAVGAICMEILALFETSFYYLLDKHFKHSLSVFSLYLVPVLILLAACLFVPDLIWWSFGASALFCLVILVLARIDINNIINSLEGNLVCFETAVPYDNGAIGPLMSSVTDYLKLNKIDGVRTNAIEHCIDELSYNLIKHAPEKLLKKNFELRIVILDKDIDLFFKYAGRPFNPVFEFTDTAYEAQSNNQKAMLALRLFNHYATDPWYQYVQGVNVVAMRMKEE